MNSRKDRKIRRPRTARELAERGDGAAVLEREIDFSPTMGCKKESATQRVDPSRYLMLAKRSALHRRESTPSSWLGEESH